MGGPQKRSVVVVAPPGPGGTALGELVSAASGAWTSTRVTPSELARNPQAIQSAAAIIVLSDPNGDPPPSLPPEIPVIACGARPPASLDSVSWVRRPSAAVLSALLSEIVGPDSAKFPPPAIVPHVSSAPPSSQGVWRRKTDMIIGHSVAIRQVLDALDRIASSAAAVTITGESGTGKELVARALHYSSPRARAPFITLNCAAIPESLFEAELFGYVRGAFTGAVAARTGAFEAAHGGTLFLDEIGEMSRTLQPKLLRVLERGDVTRIGSNEPRRVAVRVVTATNRNLEHEVRAGNFREDLYYRLLVCHVHVPPLRERPEDIAPLVAHHLSIIAGREQRSTVPRLSGPALERLLAHRWPGNVRELVNLLEAAVLLAPAGVIDAEHLQFGAIDVSNASDKDTPILAYREAKARFDATYYARVLTAARGNVSLASKLAQKTRKEIYDALRRAGIEADAYRDDEIAHGR